MAQRLEQTQRAIDAMKAAGFKHGTYKTGGEFRVETPLNKKCMAYTDTYIYHHDASDEKVEAAIPALLANGLGVYTHISASGRTSYSIVTDYEMEGKHVVIDFARTDDWGIPSRTTYTAEDYQHHEEEEHTMQHPIDQSIDIAVDKFNKEAHRRYEESVRREFVENMQHFYAKAIEEGDEEQAQKIAEALGGR